MCFVRVLVVDVKRDGVVGRLSVAVSLPSYGVCVFVIIEKRSSNTIISMAHCIVPSSSRIILNQYHYVAGRSDIIEVTLGLRGAARRTGRNTCGQYPPLP